MSNLTEHYQTLKLDDGASLEEVKAAYRVLAKRADSDEETLQGIELAFKSLEKALAPKVGVNVGDKFMTPEVILAAGDHYEVLGLTIEAGYEELRAAYRSLSKYYHPDLRKNVEEVFKKIAEANTILSDPQERAAYDRTLKAKQNTASVDNSSIFSTGAQQERDKYRDPNALDGMDIKKEVELSIIDTIEPQEVIVRNRIKVYCTSCLATGKIIPDHVQICVYCNGTRVQQKNNKNVVGIVATTETPCPHCFNEPDPRVDCDDCEGKGFNEQPVKVEVQIPAGVTNGRTLTVEGQGHPGFLGGKDGDLYLTVKVITPDNLTMEGSDVVLPIRFKYSDLIRGVKQTIEPLGEPVRLNIPPMTPPGTRIVLEEAGIPQVNSARRGSLIIVVDLSMPRLTEQHLAVLDRLNL